MSGWRDIILSEFPTQVARLTLVADPDGLLTEEGILQGLQQRGFDLIEFEDSVAFRYAYESKYRNLWDKGETTDLPAPRDGTFYVYVLKCSDDSFYVGQTNDVPIRMGQHHDGKVSWTAPRRPVELVHWEMYCSREEAVSREKDLKTGYGRKWLKREYSRDRLAARQAGLVVVLRSREQDLRKLPYDLYQAGRKLSFSIPKIFPNLNYPAVEALGASHFDSLYRAQEQYKPARMGSNQTADFILLHVFETEPKLICRPAQLLHFLMRKHYRSKVIPERLTERFIQILRQGGQFDDWPLDRIVANRSDFFTFLQERWDLRVHAEAKASGNRVEEAEDEYGFQVPGPTTLPFEHDDVRVYLDNLFNEGMLQPVALPADAGSLEGWLAAGISNGPAKDRERRLDHAQQKLVEALPDADSPHQDWMDYARILGDVRALQYLKTGQVFDQQGHPAVEGLFMDWLMKRYGSLHNQPPSPPVMVHHIPKTMSAWLAKNPGTRMALLVVDGMAMGQWSVLREVLREQQTNIRFEEQAIFAWIPTLTSFSRQSIFSGKLPQFFPDSIYTTSKESNLWKQFWVDRGIDANEVKYMTSLSPAKEQELLSVIEDERVRVLGLVINTIDEIMHGMMLGAAGMYNQVEQWSRQGYLLAVLKLLTSHGFTVFLTSDHGNIEAKGIGNPSEGSIAETRGQRVRIYNSTELRAKIAAGTPGVIPWPQIGLPLGVLPLLAPTDSAFIKSGDITVSHGGASIEEVIVPFVSVSGDG